MKKGEALKKVFSVASLISLGWMGPGLVDYLTGHEKTGNDSESSAVVQANPTSLMNKDGLSRIKVTTITEAMGLVAIGAEGRERLARIKDERDLCNVTKGNAIINGPAPEGDRYTKEFQSCADRTLHYQAALLQAGALLGKDNYKVMSDADICGVEAIAQLRAVKKYDIEANTNAMTHDLMLSMMNTALDNCGKLNGDYKIPGATWNDFANKMAITPFFSQKPAGPS